MKRFLLGAAVLFVSFTSASAQFTFTSIDYPGGTQTKIRGINDHGEIVGGYRVMPPGHALLISGGQFLPLDPNSVLGTDASAAWKINDRGDVVGLYAGSDGLSHGFLLRKGVLTTLDFPGASDTYATGIMSPASSSDTGTFSTQMGTH